MLRRRHRPTRRLTASRQIGGALLRRSFADIGPPATEVPHRRECVDLGASLLHTLQQRVAKGAVLVLRQSVRLEVKGNPSPNHPPHAGVSRVSHHDTAIEHCKRSRRPKIRAHPAAWPECGTIVMTQGRHDGERCQDACGTAWARTQGLQAGQKFVGCDARVRIRSEQDGVGKWRSEHRRGRSNAPQACCLGAVPKSGSEGPRPSNYDVIEHLATDRRHRVGRQSRGAWGQERLASHKCSHTRPPQRPHGHLCRADLLK